MSLFHIILASLSILAGAAATLMAVVFMAAGAANLKAEALTAHYRRMWAVGVGNTASCIAALALLFLQYPLLACGIGLLPVFLILACVIWVMMS